MHQHIKSSPPKKKKEKSLYCRAWVDTAAKMAVSWGNVLENFRTAVRTQWKKKNKWIKKACEKQPCRLQGQRTSRGRRCFRLWSRDSPAACGTDPSKVGCLSAACGEFHARADLHVAASGGPHTGACGYTNPEGRCSPWKDHTSAGKMCEEEWFTERNWQKLPFPFLPVPFGRKEVENFGMNHCVWPWEKWEQ